MSKAIHLTVDLNIDDVEDYLYQDRVRRLWDNLSLEDKWDCFDYIWDHQDDTEFEMGFYDGDLCAMVEEWCNNNRVSESRRRIPRRIQR